MIYGCFFAFASLPGGGSEGGRFEDDVFLIIMKIYFVAGE
jgi:hypothetical protein